jgi:hypothetical protein
MLNRYLVHVRNAAQRWFDCHNVGPSPHRRGYHAMASDGTRVFVLGGYLAGSRVYDIHVFDTGMYCRSIISSGQPPRLGTQSTSKFQTPSPALSTLTRGPPNLSGSQVPRPSHNPRHLLHWRPTALPVCKQLTLLYRAALPPCRLVTGH